MRNTSQQEWRRMNRLYKIWFFVWMISTLMISIWWKSPWASRPSIWCYCITSSRRTFNADGSMRKTAKSKLNQSFSRHLLHEVPSAYISLVDMELIWRVASHISDDNDAKTRNGKNYVWHYYLNKVWSMVYSSHNNATTIILINDNYTVLTSIKEEEHKYGAVTHTNLSNVYPKEAE